MRSLLIISLLVAATSARAQTAPQKTEEQLRASWGAHHGEFDYLLGDWAIDTDHQQYGRIRGFWSAVRIEGGAILDEYRLVGDTGETWYVSSTMRSWNALLDRWELVSVEEGTGLRNIGTGRKVGAEMHIEQTFGATTPQPSQWRIRYYDIRPDRFSWTADRSTDGGRTWVRNYLRIEARRIGPPRALGALAPARRGR